MDNALNSAPFICGNDYTIADCCLTPILVRMEDIDLMDMLEPFRNVLAWYQRMQLRPSFDTAYYNGARIWSKRPGYAARDL
jgi:glutathione S-transferase